MSESDAKLSYKKRRRAVVASVSLVAVLAAGGLLLGFVQHVRESADRVH